MAPVLKLVCQPNYQDGCALAGLTDQYSSGGIGSDRPSEKRKVGSSTLPLTTSTDNVRKALISENVSCCVEPRTELLVRSHPLVTAGRLTLVHAEGTEFAVGTNTTCYGPAWRCLMSCGGS
jgi:hypothetical protein